ncbi:MAG TPA: glycosyltransferase family 9 protein [Methylomirabilota bacterium]|nr:glycosyltransferase family 9 protein [Methylomirabilota bacterium]
MEPRENILLIRLKSIGDILFTLPAVHVVRENFPDAKLHFLVSKEHAPLLRGFLDVNEIILLDRATFRSKNIFAASAGIFQLLRRLRKQHFSLAIDFQGYGETEFLSWWSGAPQRLGNVYKNMRGWTYTETSSRDGKIHPAEGNLELLRRCGLRADRIRNEYILPADALAEARKFFATNHLNPEKPALFIQPFTSNPKKNWPLENFLELARHFHSRGAQIIFGGGPSERAAMEPARAAGFSISAGVPLLVTGGLMKLSTLTVGGDTGLLHLASAMGKRVVMLMKSNAAGMCHPFQHANWTLTPPAGKPVSEIQTNSVIEKCARAFADCEAEANGVNLPGSSQKK